MDSRFTCRFPSSSDKVKGTAYDKATKTASFTQIRSWQEGLALVHQYAWELLKAELPLPSGQVEQRPGAVPQESLDALQPIISELPEPKRYNK